MRLLDINTAATTTSAFLQQGIIGVIVRRRRINILFFLVGLMTGTVNGFVKNQQHQQPHCRCTSPSRLLLSLADNNNNDHNHVIPVSSDPPQANHGFPRVYEWKRSNNNNNDDDDGHGTTMILPLAPPFSAPAATAMWNWCKYFVVPHNLCPWAAASVQTAGAVSIYLIHHDDDDGDDNFRDALHDVAKRFIDEMNSQHAQYDQAIALVVDVSGDDTWQDFAAFYQHFDDLWDEFMNDEAYDAIMLAPFHPQWHYGGLLDDDNDDNDDTLDLEKQSPYPTISIVAQHVLDQAGPRATERIAATNQATLRQFDGTTWRKIYAQAVERGIIWHDESKRNGNATATNKNNNKNNNNSSSHVSP